MKKIKLSFSYFWYVSILPKKSCPSITLTLYNLLSYNALWYTFISNSIGQGDSFLVFIWINVSWKFSPNNLSANKISSLSFDLSLVLLLKWCIIPNFKLSSSANVLIKPSTPIWNFLLK